MPILATRSPLIENIFWYSLVGIENVEFLIQNHWFEFFGEAGNWLENIYLKYFLGFGFLRQFMVLWIFLGESSTPGILAQSANESTRTYQIVNSMIMIKATLANIVNWLWIHFACRKKKIFTIYKKFFFCSKVIHVPVFIRLENSILVFQQN